MTICNVFCCVLLLLFGVVGSKKGVGSKRRREGRGSKGNIARFH